MPQFPGGKGYHLIQDPEKREKYEGLVKETIRELYSNARYWEFFKGFNEESVHDFIAEYAARKAWYLINGDRIRTKKEREEFRFRDMAENCLWEIQQKKLFNMQAEWRAGLIEIPGVFVTRDFLCWEKAIHLCPFLEPVSAKELQFYMDYVESDFHQEKSWIYNWQDYETFKNNADRLDVIPAWYRFWDLHFGTDYLMILPDKKGEEEKRYLAEWNKVHGKNNALCIYDDGSVSTNSPNLYVNYETLSFFINTFENHALQEFFSTSESKPQDAEKDAELQDALRLLNKAEGNVRLPAATDWKESIIKGAKEFKKKKIITNLPYVFDEYLFRLRTGILPTTNEEDGIYEECLAFATLYREQINEGRKLCGEE